MEIVYKNKDIFSDIENYYDILVDENTNLNSFIDNIGVPRNLYENRIGFIQPWRCIKYLLELNPESIADIGCGKNDFKRFIPNLIGFDPYSDKADIQERFDSEFVDRYKHSFDSAFSICALHFVTLDYFSQRVLEFKNIIKPGGRGYLALNLARMIEDAPEKKNIDYLIDLFGSVNPDTQQVKQYIENEINELKLDLVMSKVDFTIYDEYINGNIILVFNA